jgi:hypothetical protein
MSFIVFKQFIWTYLDKFELVWFHSFTNNCSNLGDYKTHTKWKTIALE